MMAKYPNSMVRIDSQLSKNVIDYVHPQHGEMTVKFVVTLLSDNTARGHFTVNQVVDTIFGVVSGDTLIRKFKTVQALLDFEKELKNQGFQRINADPSTSRGSHLTKIK